MCLTTFSPAPMDSFASLFAVPRLSPPPQLVISLLSMPMEEAPAASPNRRRVGERIAKHVRICTRDPDAPRLRITVIALQLRRSDPVEIAFTAKSYDERRTGQLPTVLHRFQLTLFDLERFTQKPALCGFGAGSRKTHLVISDLPIEAA